MIDIKAGQIRKTMSTIWAGVRTVKEHHDNCADEDPGPVLPQPAPIPMKP
jgi:hypothetical protein